MNQLLHFRVNKAVGDDFLVALVVKQRFYTFQRQISFAVGAHNQPRLHRPIRNIVIPVNAGHLFDQVLFDGNIEAPARCNGLPLTVADGHLTAQASQNIAHLRIINMMANQTIQFATTQGNGRRLRQRSFVGRIDNRARFAAADIDQQAGCTFHRFILQR